MRPPLTAETLTASASSFADRALKAYEDRDHLVLLPMLGVMLEHLMKAVLAKENPAYLVDFRQNFSTLLLLTGNPKAATADVRTIGASQALTRVAHFVALPQKDSLQRVLDVRNGVLHTGVSGDPKTAFVDMVATLQAAKRLLTALEVAPAAFFGEGNWELVTSLLEKRRSEVEHEVARRKAAASRTYWELGADPDALNHRWHAATLLEFGDTGDFHFIRQQECPVCGADCQLIGDVEVDVDVDVDVGDGQAVMYPFAVPVWSPTHLICSVCGLRLDNSEQLAVVSLEGREQLSEKDYALTQEEIDEALSRSN